MFFILVTENAVLGKVKELSVVLQKSEERRGEVLLRLHRERQENAKCIRNFL